MNPLFTHKVSYFYLWHDAVDTETSVSIISIPYKSEGCIIVCLRGES